MTLQADWTDGSPEVSELLEALGSKQLPVIAVFPAGNAYRPQKLTGFYSKGDLIRSLRAAGPSRDIPTQQVAERAARAGG